METKTTSMLDVMMPHLSFTQKHDVQRNSMSSQHNMWTREMKEARLTLLFLFTSKKKTKDEDEHLKLKRSFYFQNII